MLVQFLVTNCPSHHSSACPLSLLPPDLMISFPEPSLIATQTGNTDPMRDEVVADMILAPMLLEVMVEPGDSAHLGTEHTDRVPVPSDDLCLYCCVVASEDLHDWLRTHDDRGNALSVAGQEHDRG